VYPWLRKVDVWITVDPAKDPKEFFPELRWMGAIGRLKPGASIEQARAEMSVFGQRLARERSETDREWTADALSLQEAWFGSTRKLFYVLLGAVGFVLLIACANVANLLLARAGARNTEMAIRASLGGTRTRIVRQLLTESFVLAMIGGMLGLASSYGGVKLFVALVPRLGTLVDTVAIDGRVMLFTLALALLTGILFGTAPAIRISTYDLNRCLKEGGDRSGGGTRNLSGDLLVVGEVALTLILLAGAGLMVNSFVRLLGTGLGFNPSHLLTADVQLDGTKYRQLIEGDLQRATPASDDFFQQTVERLQKTPGAVSAALEGASGRCLFRIAGRSESGREPTAVFAEIDGGYFRTMQIPLLAGRHVTAQDDEHSPWVAIVNAAMAKRYFPGEDPVGKQLYLTHTDASGRQVREPNPRAIVGVVADAREFGPSREAQPLLYLPYRQHIREYLGGNGHTHFSKRLLIRTRGNPLALTRAVRSIVGEVDRTQIAHNIESMDQIMAARVAPWRFSMQIFGVLASIALALAAVGIFGVMSYTVSRRTHEIGVRMALGASLGDVLGLVMKQGLTLTLSGIGLGLAGALGLTRFVTSMLYGVRPADPLTFSIVSVVLMGVALAACYLPARRAMSVDPVRALRSD
jgi:putative ABC transport system permease protein